MTKTKKTIMWSTIACLAAVAVAGGAVGVTYARYASTGTGTGTAEIAYWDVAITANDSTDVKAYAAPSAAEYTEESYSADAARTNTSSLILAATVANSGNVAASVTITQEGGFGYTLREGGDTSTTEHIETLDDHFAVKLFVGDADSYTSEGDGLSELSGPIDVGAAYESTATAKYIYCEVVWTSDIDGCFGDDADAFDTWIGTNVEYLTFTLAYSATQAATD
ncbi:MAG: hypothetical protein LUD22_01325 [Coprobacillus sp.]|nr:hypothetical protein [Coprobacillus sp.]